MLDSFSYLSNAELRLAPPSRAVIIFDLKKKRSCEKGSKTKRGNGPCKKPKGLEEILK